MSGLFSFRTRKTKLRELPGSPFPTLDQRLLLQAALLPATEADAAWSTWKERNDFMGYLDYGSFRVLPLLYKNLASRDIDEPLLPRLKGTYRQTWCKNQQLMHEAGEVLQLFSEHSIPLLVLKGLALSILHYQDIGTRPMSDIDALIRFSDAERALKILKDAGWIPENEAHIEFNLLYGKSMGFKNAKGVEFDLHWHPFFESHGTQSDEDFWQKAVPLKIGTHEVLALCPEDAFLHVVVHGLRWNPDPPIRWISDSLIILRSTGSQFDWNRLLQQVTKHRMALQFREAFHYLQDHFQMKVPQDVMTAIYAMPIGFAERFVYKNNIRQDAETLPESFFPRLRYLFSIYLRQSRRNNILAQSFGFLNFLLYRTSGKNRVKIIWYYLWRRGK